MSDLISREAILKHIEKIRQNLQMMDDTYRISIVMEGVYICESVVRNQTSAQSEIIRCKDCKYRGVGDYCVYGTRLAWVTKSNDFCSKAERRGE